MSSEQTTILVHYLPPLNTSHAHELIQKIKSHGGSSSTTLAKDGRDMDWRITNKYYTADVQFSVVSKDGSTENEAEVAAVGGEEPAVIVLLPRKAAPPKEADALLRSLSAREAEFEVALLVSYDLPSENATEAEEKLLPDEWEDIALSHGFEWVDLEGASEGGGGIARVVGALHAHMWEGMVKEPPPAKLERRAPLQRTEDDEEDEDFGEFQAMGAPPLPEPRPYVPLAVEFPSTFLPSILRASTSQLSPPSAPPLPPSAASTDASSSTLTFEDDFAPFVPIASSFSDPPTPPRIPSPLPSSLYRHPELAFPDSEDGYLKLDDDEEGGEGEEDLTEMFEKLKALRGQAEGLGLEERRAMAEKAVLALIGES